MKLETKWDAVLLETGWTGETSAHIQVCCCYEALSSDQDQDQIDCFQPAATARPSALTLT